MDSQQDKTRKLILLPISYFGPVQLFSKFLLDGRHVIEQYDHYQKQTYRNRCVIYGANGPVSLSIPVKRNRGVKNVVRDVRIDYDTDWRKLHWRSITSAYNSSPFFEYFRDLLEPFYTNKYNYLVDFTFDSTFELLRCLDIYTEISLSQEYEFPGSDLIHYDFREIISPKKDFQQDELFSPFPYQQVFSEKSGFIPNLSIIDLLMNTGAEAKSIMMKSIKLDNLV